jgi:branched-chain amino acid aminotransferase
MSTPPLGGTILPGITRSSLLTLAKDKGIKVREERYSYDQWKADAGSGKLREAFACGTAAVVTSIGTVRAPEGEFKIGNGGSGARTEELKSALVDIQRCRAPDPHKWIHRVF